jgi:hypothetical protein
MFGCQSLVPSFCRAVQRQMTGKSQLPRAQAEAFHASKRFARIRPRPEHQSNFKIF